MPGRPCCRLSRTEASSSRSKTTPWLFQSAGTLMSGRDHGLYGLEDHPLSPAVCLHPRQSFQRHRGAADEAAVVREMHRDGQAGGRCCQGGTAQNHSRPPPQDLVQLDGQHQVRVFPQLFPTPNALLNVLFIADDAATAVSAFIRCTICTIGLFAELRAKLQLSIDNCILMYWGES